LGISAAIGR